MADENERLDPGRDDPARILRRLEDRLEGMTRESGELTEAILGDLSGIRAEQMHLARRIELLSTELRTDIRKELTRASGAEMVQDTAPRSGRSIWGLIGLLFVILLTVLLALLGLAITPNSFGLSDWLLDWLPQIGPGQEQ